MSSQFHSLTKPLGPYLEASIFLRCKYMDQTGWHSLTMPVTTEAANIGGRRLGFPKYVADK
ncbi:MAG: acetoacetate decarboxylase family protein [Desulfobacteraceae bacterium]|nr:acetoacetate decarboxylase family protein [Desulfobacteraceae bacterium]